MDITKQKVSDKDWQKIVRQQADRIKDLCKDVEVYGRKYKQNNIDALVVAVWLQGGREGSKNSFAIMEEILRSHGIDPNEARKQ